MSKETDRELLEWAAKAAGINAKWYDFTGCMMRICSGQGLTRWEPHIDQGDALRLAADLKINIFLAEAGFVTAGRSGIIGMRENVNDNLYAATCRAIVRAAAEIGKNLGNK